MNLKRKSALQALFVGAMVMPWATGCAQPHSAARDIDEQADPILKRMCAALDGAKALRVHVRATMDGVVDTGQLAQFNRESDIILSRPDRLSARTRADEGYWSAWYQGGKLTIFDEDDHAYSTEQVPGRIDAMLDYMADEYDLIMPMADLLVGKTYDSLVENVEVGTYLGLHEVGDTPCHHLLFRQENIDWQIWIDAGSQPLPRKLVITYVEEHNQPQYVAMLDGWDLSPTVTDETFKFTPPADAQAVSMEDLIAQN